MPKPPRFKPKELVKLALKSGFVLNRTQGSHFIYFRLLDEKSISIPIHGSKPLGNGMLNIEYRLISRHSTFDIPYSNHLIRRRIFAKIDSRRL